LTKERGGATVEATDRENGLKKEKEGQRESKTESLPISSSLSNMSPLTILLFQTDEIRKVKKMERRLDLEREEEISNHARNEGMCDSTRRRQRDTDKLQNKERENSEF